MNKNKPLQPLDPIFNSAFKLGEWLGIVSNDDLGGQPQHFSWESESQLVLCSDGLLEATNPENVEFGAAGLIAAAANTSPSDRFEKIEMALVRHQNNCIASDDISLMLIDCP